MSVATIDSPRGRHGDAPLAPVAPIRPADTRSAENSRPVTVTVTVTLSGESALSAADQVKDSLWRLATTIPTDGAVVDVASTIATATQPDARPQPHRPAGTAPLTILAAARIATLDGVPLSLTRREYDLLHHLAVHPGRVFRRRQLFRAVWDGELFYGERTIDVHVHRLRGKLGERGPVITTVRGVGYRLDAGHRVRVVPE